MEKGRDNAALALSMAMREFNAGLGADTIIRWSNAAIDAYLSSPEHQELNQWQDISTAPKDGTLSVLWSPSTHTYTIYGRFWEQDNVWLDDAGVQMEPTRWQPLPKPPKE